MPRAAREQWIRISEQLDRVLDLADPERSEYLAQLERTDPAVAADVREMLSMRGRPGFGGFLAEMLSLKDELAAAASLIGDRLGPYVIEGPVGRGGMGTVWRARRADGQYEGQVAIKVINAALVGRPAEQRFRREGTMLAELRHAHIAQLLDAGIAPSGQAYLVLEYIEGVRIDEYCATNGLATKERIRLFLDVLSAVAHAHSHLIIHRDIKPTNILVTAGGAVKLLDFGIAALITHDGDPAAHTRTVEASAAFTPEYATPEQLLNRPVTTATDVYALGLVLFVLLAGRHPHAAAGNSAVERIRTVVEQDAPPLSGSVEDPGVARTLRGDLDNILAKALRCEPTERYSTADALADDLRRYLANEPVRARPDSLAYRAGKFVARHRGSVFTGTLTVVGLIGLSVFAWLQMNEARSQRDEALLQKKRAESESSFVTMMLDSVGDAQKPLTLTDLLDRGLVLLDRQYANDPPFRVHTLINMSGRFMDAGQTDREFAALAKAESIARKTGDPLLLAEVECDTVETEIAAGHNEQAARRLKEGQAALGRGDPPLDLVVDCLHAEASLTDAQGDLNRAAELIAQSVRLLEQAGSRRTRGVQYTGLLSHLAVLYSRQGNERGSFDASLKELRVLEQVGSGGTLQELATRNNVARSLNNFGEVRDALDTLHAALKEREFADSSIAIHPFLSATYGEVLARLADTSTAIAWMDRGVADAQRAGSPSQELSVRVRRASVLVQANCLPQAAADLDEIERRVAGHEKEYRATAQLLPVTRAEYELALGNPLAAQATIASLLPKDAQHLPTAANASGMRMLRVASRIAIVQGRLDDAEHLADEELALASQRARNPEASADVGDAYLMKATTLARKGRETEARNAAIHARDALTKGLGPSHPLTREATTLTSALAQPALSILVAGSAASSCHAP